MNPSELPFRNPSLPVDRRVEDLVNRLTLAEKVAQMPQYQAEVPRLGLAAYKHGTEAAHGISWLGKATAYPQPTGLASTWDKSLLERVGEAIGTEARGFFARDPKVNGLTLWAPTVDLERDPRWGRTEEAYGEDPFLAGHLAGSLVKGIQGRDPAYLRAVATLKHFWGNNQEIDRGTESTNVDEAQQRDEYLRSFEIAFRVYGAQSMMTAYNSVNGVPCNLNPQVNDIVRGEWGWRGFVVSDAGDVTGTVREHGYLRTWPEAFAASIRAGIDSITDNTADVIGAIEQALALGLLAEADLDAALKRTFRIRFLLGEFDPAGLCPYSSIGENVIGLPAHAALSREASAKAVVLLKNDGLLPLGQPNSLAVIGPLADEVFRDWYSGSLPYAVTPLAGLKARFPQASVSFASGSDRVQLPWGEFEVTDWGWGSSTLRHTESGKWLVAADDGLKAASEEVFGWFTKEVFGVHDLGGGKAALTTWNGTPVVRASSGQLEALAEDAAREGRIGIDSSAPGAVDPAFVARTAAVLDWKVTETGQARAVEAARQADVAVVFVGSHPLITAKETIDRPDIVLPPAQEALLKAVTAANPRTVAVVVSGYPLSSPSNFGGARAVVTTGHAGQELGNALADVLSGDVNPAGRVPLTWYRSVGDLPPLKDYDLTKGRTYRYVQKAVQFPFGHGLSYTRFDYAALVVTATPRSVSFTLTNGGPRDGEEVVQVYLAALDASRPVPLKKLAAFDRVFLKAGETRPITLALDPEEFSSWNPTLHRRDLPSRRFEVAVGASSSDLRVRAILEL